MGRQYHYNERVIGVCQTRFRGDFIGAWRSDTGTLHRIHSQYLPACKTAEECQKHLDALALKKKLDEVRALPCEEGTPQPGREVPPGGLVGGRQYLAKRRYRPDRPYQSVEYRGMADGRHMFYIEGSGCARPFPPLSTAALCHYEIRAYAS